MTIAAIVAVCIVLLVLGFLRAAAVHLAAAGRGPDARRRSARGRQGARADREAVLEDVRHLTEGDEQERVHGPARARQDAGLAGPLPGYSGRSSSSGAGAAGQHVELHLGRRAGTSSSVGGPSSSTAPLRLAQHLRHRDALAGVVGGVQDVVGELADVLDQPLALLPQDARVEDDLLRVGVGLLAQQLGLALGSLDAPLGLGARAGGDLLGGLVGALEDAGGLLADLGDRPLDDRFLRLAALEVADDLDAPPAGTRRPPRGRNRASPPGTCGSRSRRLCRVRSGRLGIRLCRNRPSTGP